MKKKITISLTVVIIAVGILLTVIGAPKNNTDSIQTYNDKNTDQYNNLSDETKEWLEWYQTLTPNEQLAVSYIPSELRDSQYMQNEIQDTIPKD